MSPIEKHKSFSDRTTHKSFDDYDAILVSNFFKLGTEVEDLPITETVTPESLQDLTLLGTITGPSSIARALIKKKREKESQIFKLWNDVYGYQLVRIANSKVYLKMGDEVTNLDMFAKDEKALGSGTASTVKGRNNKSSKTISRSEIQQKVFNNIDNALKGLRAGPYRVNGKIEGYKLFRVRPNNILYQLGARSGDVIKRINGHPLDSTDKLIKMWQNLQGETRLSVDLERRGKLQTFDFSVTE